MITIYKYPFPVCNPNSIAIVELPSKAEIIRLDTENGHPFLWAIVDTDKPTVQRKFFLHKTGSDMTASAKDIALLKCAGNLSFLELSCKWEYVGRFGIWAEMELMMYVFDGGEIESH